MGGFAVIKPLSLFNGKVCIKEIENYYSWFIIKAPFDHVGIFFTLVIEIYNITALDSILTM